MGFKIFKNKIYNQKLLRKCNNAVCFVCFHLGDPHPFLKETRAPFESCSLAWLIFFFFSFSDQLKMSGIRKTKLKPKQKPHHTTPGSLPLNKLDSQHKQQNNGQEDVTNKRRGKSQAALFAYAAKQKSLGLGFFPFLFNISVHFNKLR